MPNRIGDVAARLAVILPPTVEQIAFPLRTSALWAATVCGWAAQSGQEVRPSALAGFSIAP
jgi:hypothetical protein